MIKGAMCPYGVIFNEGRKLRIRHHPIENTIYLFGYPAVNFQLGYIPFHTTGFHEP